VPFIPRYSSYNQLFHNYSIGLVERLCLLALMLLLFVLDVGYDQSLVVTTKSF